MTPEEKTRKKEARRLIVTTPVSQHGDNVICTPVGILQFAKYQVIFPNNISVYFQYYGKRLYYLGEYPTVQKTMSEQELNEVLEGIN